MIIFCEMIIYRECVSGAAGYKMLIDIPEWHVPFGMFSEKLGVSRNESAEISNAKVNDYIFLGRCSSSLLVNLPRKKDG